MAKEIETMEEFPYIEAIRSLMLEFNLNQQKFAESIGVNQTTVSQWLLGRKKPSYDVILSICKTYGITPNILFGYE